MLVEFEQFMLCVIHDYLLIVFLLLVVFCVKGGKKDFIWNLHNSMILIDYNNKTGKASGLLLHCYGVVIAAYIHESFHSKTLYFSFFCEIKLNTSSH